MKRKEPETCISLSDLPIKEMNDILNFLDYVDVIHLFSTSSYFYHLNGFSLNNPLYGQSINNILVGRRGAVSNLYIGSYADYLGVLSYVNHQGSKVVSLSFYLYSPMMRLAERGDRDEKEIETEVLRGIQNILHLVSNLTDLTIEISIGERFFRRNYPISLSGLTKLRRLSMKNVVLMPDEYPTTNLHTLEYHNVFNSVVDYNYYSSTVSDFLNHFTQLQHLRMSNLKITIGGDDDDDDDDDDGDNDDDDDVREVVLSTEEILQGLVRVTKNCKNSLEIFSLNFYPNENFDLLPQRILRSFKDCTKLKRLEMLNSVEFSTTSTTALQSLLVSNPHLNFTYDNVDNHLSDKFSMWLLLNNKNLELFKYGYHPSPADSESKIEDVFLLTEERPLLKEIDIKFCSPSVDIKVFHQLFLHCPNVRRIELYFEQEKAFKGDILDILPIEVPFMYLEELEISESFKSKLRCGLGKLCYLPSLKTLHLNCSHINLRPTDVFLNLKEVRIRQVAHDELILLPKIFPNLEIFGGDIDFMDKEFDFLIEVLSNIKTMKSLYISGCVEGEQIISMESKCSYNIFCV